LAIIVPAVLLALPLIHDFPSLTRQQLHPVPLQMSGMVCASPKDMKGMYAINRAGKAKSIADLVAIAKDSGFDCTVLENSRVMNGGQVLGPDGQIEVAGGTPLPIFELIKTEGGKDTYYYVIAKKQ
jgi:hypothetical protein